MSPFGIKINIAVNGSVKLSASQGCCQKSSGGQVRNMQTSDRFLGSKPLETMKRGIRRLNPMLIRERIVVLWTVYTFLSGVLNLLILEKTLPTVLAVQPPVLPIFELPLAIVLFIIGKLAVAFLLLFFVPIAISAVASQVLPQKRYVGMLDINIVTAGIYLYQVGSSGWSFPDVGFAVLGIVFLPMLGIVADFVGRRYVGLGERDTFQDVFTVDAPIKEIDAFLNRKEFARAFGLDDRRTSRDGKLVFFRSLGMDYRFFVVLAELGEKRTLLDFEGYDILRYVIEGTKESKRRFDRDVKDLVQTLRDEKNVKVDTASYDDAGSYKAVIDQVVLEPARPTMPRMRRLPKSTWAILLGLLMLAFTAYLLFIDRNLTPESFLTALFGLGSLLVGLIPFMKWTPRRKGWQKVGG
jgi:hypothetical protein